MNGIVGFENYRIRCLIGIKSEERILKQDLFIDLKVEVDLSACISKGSVEETVDYTALACLCDVISKNNYGLLEQFGGDVIENIFNKYPVTQVWIKVKKPHAISNADFAIVEMTKKRSS